MATYFVAGLFFILLLVVLLVLRVLNKQIKRINNNYYDGDMYNTVSDVFLMQRRMYAKKNKTAPSEQPDQDSVHSAEFSNSNADEALPQDAPVHAHDGHHPETWENRVRPYKRKSRLLTPNRSIMLEKLRLVFPRSDFEVFPNVRLADLITVDIPDWQGSRRDLELNDIAQFHLDFVICRKITTEVLAVIEIEDTNAPPHLVDSKSRALQAAGVSVHRLQGSAADNYKKLRGDILGEVPAPVSVPNPPPVQVAAA